MALGNYKPNGNKKSDQHKDFDRRPTYRLLVVIPVKSITHARVCSAHINAVDYALGYHQRHTIDAAGYGVQFCFTRYHPRAVLVISAAIGNVLGGIHLLLGHDSRWLYIRRCLWPYGASTIATKNIPRSTS